MLKLSIATLLFIMFFAICFTGCYTKLAVPDYTIITTDTDTTNTSIGQEVVIITEPPPPPIIIIYPPPIHAPTRPVHVSRTCEPPKPEIQQRDFVRRGAQKNSNSKNDQQNNNQISQKRSKR